MVSNLNISSKEARKISTSTTPSNLVINKFPNREVYEKIKAKGSLGEDDVNVLEDYGYTLTETDKTEIAGKVIADGTEFTLSEFPTALKNPHALTFTGAAAVTNIIDTIGISANTRLSTSSGANRAQSGYAAIGANEDAASLIHLAAGDTLRIKGASLPASNDSYSAIALHNASGTFSTSTYLHNGLTWNGMTFNNAGDSVVVTAVGEHYFRVSMICTDASKVVATINEAIE